MGIDDAVANALGFEVGADSGDARADCAAVDGGAERPRAGSTTRPPTTMRSYMG